MTNDKTTTPKPEHSLGWLLTITDDTGEGHELFAQNNVIYMTATTNPINYSGYRSPSRPLTVLGRWPILRRQILADNCDGWTHQESDLSRNLVLVTENR